MRKRFENLIAWAETNPHKLLGFGAGAAVPLVVATLFWAQTSGGLGGPLFDPRPPAFVVLTD